MPERLHPGVYVEEVKPAVRAIEGVSTSTAAFIGVAERGPVGKAVLVTSFPEYSRRFGGHRSDSFLTYSVQYFFGNGGKKCYIVRVVGSGAVTAAIELRDRERVDLSGPVEEDILAEAYPSAFAEPALSVQAASPGKWGNLIDVEIQNGTSDPENEFKIVVKFRDEVVETWDNLSMVLGDENYVENLLGEDQSQYIQVKSIPTVTSDTPGVFISGELDSSAENLSTVADTAVIAIELSGATVNPLVLAKSGKNTGEKVAQEIQDKVRDAAPATGTTEQKRAFEKFECVFVSGPPARYVLVSGSDADPRTIDVPAATTGAGQTDARGHLKLDTSAAGSDQAFSIPGKGLQRGTSVSDNEPATSTDGNRNLSFNLNRDGFQTVQLASGLADGDAVADNIQAEVRAASTLRKDPANENAYSNFDATYNAYYELTFGDVDGDAGTFTFVSYTPASDDMSTDARLRLRASTPSGGETTYGGNTTGPLTIAAGLTDRQRTILSGSIKGTRPLADVSAITDGVLRLAVDPPGADPVVDLDLTFAGPGPSTGEEIAEAIQDLVRAKATDAVFTSHPNTQDALSGFTAKYVAYYTLSSGDVRQTDEAGDSAGPISSVEVLPAPTGDVAPSLKLGLVNGGVERVGAEKLRPPIGEYHVGDHTVGGAVCSVDFGADGAQPGDIDYVGDEAEGTGLYALDKIDDVSLIAIPGIGSKQVVSAGFGYCTNRTLQDCFFIADLGGAPMDDEKMFRTDVPFVTSVTDARDYVNALPTKNDYGAIYFPWLNAPDPIGRGKNPTRFLPPSGYVAGLYARTDSQRGVFKAPAGTEANLSGALDLAVKISDTEQDFLNPKGINVIRSFPASGFVIWGARTLSSDSAWRYVPVRRMAIFLRVSIYNGIQYAVFEPNDEDLWASLRLTIGGFMLTQFRAGAFQGSKPDEAFFVKCDSSTTIQADIDNGVVNILVGFAPLKPAEFVVMKLSQIAGQTSS